MRTFPCPYCVRMGLPSIESGGTDDFGVQIGPDYPCGCCDGEGFIEVGSENHFRIKCTSVVNAVQKIFGDVIEYLPEKEFEEFWDSIDSINFDSLKEMWLKLNKQKTESEVEK